MKSRGNWKRKYWKTGRKLFGSKEEEVASVTPILRRQPTRHLNMHNRANRDRKPGRYSKLKVLADVGLVGFPNAGKSTLLSVITAAKPKIADYAFTTLVPQLGMVAHREGRSFCVADLPGIIEGAAEGRGLGHRFLRHIERNPVLLFLIPADSNDHKREFEILVNELKEYNPELLHKQFVIGVSKSDMLDDELKAAIQKELPNNFPIVFFSSVTQQGIQQLKDVLWQVLNLENK